MRQKDGTKNVPCWGPKNISHRHTKFIRHTYLHPEICAPLEGVLRILQKSNLKILGTRRTTRRIFHAEDQQTLYATAQNSELGWPGARNLFTPEVKNLTVEMTVGTAFSIDCDIQTQQSSLRVTSISDTLTSLYWFVLYDHLEKLL